jgi:hypothetical protein
MMNKQDKQLQRQLLMELWYLEPQLLLLLMGMCILISALRML